MPGARRGSVDPHARTPNTQVRVIENTYTSSSSGGRVISPEQFEHHGIRHPVHHLREGSSCLAAGVAFGEFKDQVLNRLTSYANASVIKGDTKPAESRLPAPLENPPCQQLSLR